MCLGAYDWPVRKWGDQTNISRQAWRLGTFMLDAFGRGKLSDVDRVSAIHVDRLDTMGWYVVIFLEGVFVLLHNLRSLSLLVFMINRLLILFYALLKLAFRYLQLLS